MKVSELQAILKTTLEEHGDIEVEIFDINYGSGSFSFKETKVQYYFKEIQPVLIIGFEK